MRESRIGTRRGHLRPCAVLEQKRVLSGGIIDEQDNRPPSSACGMIGHDPCRNFIARDRIAHVAPCIGVRLGLCWRDVPDGAEQAVKIRPMGESSDGATMARPLTVASERGTPARMRKPRAARTRPRRSSIRMVHPRTPPGSDCCLPACGPCHARSAPRAPVPVDGSCAAGAAASACASR